MNPFDPGSSGPRSSLRAVEADENSRRWQWLAFTVAVGILVWLLAPVLTPFVISLFFGYLGDPLVDRLELARMSRTFAVLLVFFVMITMAALALVFLLPLLGGQISHFIQQMPAYADWLHKTALPWINARTHLDLAPYVDPQQVIAMLRSHWQQRHFLLQQGRVDEVALDGHRTDHDRVALFANAAHRLDPVEVDQVRRLCEAQLHHRQQAVAAGQQLGVAAVLAEQRDSVGDGARRVIVESGRDHLFCLQSWVPGDGKTRCLRRTNPTHERRLRMHEVRRCAHERRVPKLRFGLSRISCGGRL